ncbi:glycosyltransferase family 2 protein [Ornithinimicrobium sufpigmenti]|uniref:glycosyltransferase family 2 protein n=1 Tax=Ornithinimicrobium sufpigmenti TaxID=2508882 RepID=UPI0010366B25|nr:MULTISPECIES: hypothetical protein [unclassified Ornithinimicrobium]
MPGTIAVLSMTRARHSQLLAQVDGISVGSVPPQVHCVISMGDRELTRGRLPLGTDRWETIVRPVQTDRRALPIAAARNLAANLAIEAGARTLVFMDDTVIPGPTTLERLGEAVGGQRRAVLQAIPRHADDQEVTSPVVWRTPVLDLPPLAEEEVLGYPMGRLHEIASRGPDAIPLVPGQQVVDTRWGLFSGECFAMSVEDFQATGGFCADYTGRGLQDADFAEVVRQRGGTIVWVGGADAYRQPAEPVEPELQARYAARHVQTWRERWDGDPEHPWLDWLREQELLTR